MGWGDPFKDLDEQGDERRRYSIVTRGLVPGTLVTCGRVGGQPIHVWTFPEMAAPSFDAMPGWGMIIGVDCESDPSMDWLYLWLSTTNGRQVFGWLPTGLVTRVT